MRGHGAQAPQSYKYGIFSWYGYRAPMETRLAAIERAGYAASSVWRGRTEPMVREGREDHIPGMFRELGLEFEYIHGAYTNCNKLWSESAEDREVIFRDYSADVDYCRRHRVPTLVVHISKGLNPRPPSEAGLDVLSRLIAQAEDSGVRLAVENTRQPGHIDYILERLGSPSLGFCYDSSHDFLHCERPGEILARWGHRLFATHLSDNDGLTGKHWMPGQGNGDWRAIAEPRRRPSRRHARDRQNDALRRQTFVTHPELDSRALAGTGRHGGIIRGQPKALDVRRVGCESMSGPGNDQQHSEGTENVTRHSDPRQNFLSHEPRSRVMTRKGIVNPYKRAQKITLCSWCR